MQDGQVKVVDGHHLQQPVIDVLCSIFSVPGPGATRIALIMHNIKAFSVKYYSVSIICNLLSFNLLLLTLWRARAVVLHVDRVGGGVMDASCAALFYGVAALVKTE